MLFRKLRLLLLVIAAFQEAEAAVASCCDDAFQEAEAAVIVLIGAKALEQVAYGGN